MEVLCISATALLFVALVLLGLGSCLEPFALNLKPETLNPQTPKPLNPKPLNPFCTCSSIFRISPGGTDPGLFCRGGITFRVFSVLGFRVWGLRDLRVVGFRVWGFRDFEVLAFRV